MDNANEFILTGAIGYPENIGMSLKDRGLCFIKVLGGKGI